MNNKIAHIILLMVSLCWAGDNFAINVLVEYIGIELRHLSGIPYTEYHTIELEPGDTAIADSSEGIWIDNQSNIAIGLAAMAYDDTVLLPLEEPCWDIEPISGIDTCAVGIALYSESRPPVFAAVQWLNEEFSVIEPSIMPDVDKFGYIFFVAPTDPIRYLEPMHRIKLVIVAYPY